MKRYVFLAVLPLGLVLASAARAVAEDIPTDAKDQIEQFQREAARIREETEAKIAAKKADLAQRLVDLQTKYTKEGKLDEAVAIRDRVRQLEGVNDVSAPVRAGKDFVRGIAGPVAAYRVCQNVEVLWGNTT